jgi:hypothetical protein
MLSFTHGRDLVEGPERLAPASGPARHRSQKQRATNEPSAGWCRAAPRCVCRVFLQPPKGNTDAEDQPLRGRAERIAGSSMTRWSDDITNAGDRFTVATLHPRPNAWSSSPSNRQPVRQEPSEQRCRSRRHLNVLTSKNKVARFVDIRAEPVRELFGGTMSKRLIS